ncbi:MAG: nucleoside hydrolase [Sulfolobaceae archaeon]|nr:nucleoside hydrolase [Sulfolobaceae archaeon]
MRKVIFDSDTATDDTIALLLALKNYEVLGVTIVAGNVNFEQEIQNALFTLEYFGYNDVPVYPGARRPIMGEWRTVEEVHGKNGMSDWNYQTPSKKPESEFAADAIIRLSKEYNGELEILAVSPLTNLALAYLKDPEIVKRIKKVWIMGGALSRGNTTPLGEFNFWVDPEAANIVLKAGFDITVVPWETAENAATLTIQDWDKIEKINTKAAKFFVYSNRQLLEYSLKTGERGSVHPDSLTVSISIDSNIIKKSEKVYAEVETCSKSRGAMLIDWYKLLNKKSNVELVLEAFEDKFKKMLFETLSAN